MSDSHQMVNRRFHARGSGGIYLCTEYDSNEGYRMVLVAGEDHGFGRVLGDATWVSTRAIGRTYFRVEMPAIGTPAREQ